MTPKQVFLREATGLVRQLGTFDSFLLAIGNIIGPFWIVFFVAAWFLFPGVNVPATILLLVPICVVHGLYYVMISSAMPRSGGGTYVPLSRVVHPILGSGMNCVFLMSYFLVTGVVGSVFLSFVVSGPLSVMGAVTNNPALQNLASVLSTPSAILVGGTLFIVLTSLLQILGIRKVATVNTILFVVAVLGILVSAGVLASTSQAQFQVTFDTLQGSGAYDNLLKTATANGWTWPSAWLVPSLLALPVISTSMLGYQTNTYYSGEIKHVSKTMLRAMVLSLLFVVALYGGYALLMERAFGIDFITSTIYLFNAAPSDYPLSFPPFIYNLVLLINSNPLVCVLVGVSMAALCFLWGAAIFTALSRSIFAMSFDRAAPSMLGSVSDRFHSPVNATILTAIIGWIALTIYIYQPLWAIGTNVTLICEASLVLDGLAGILLPLRRDLFEAAPPLVKRKLAGIPVVSILGAYSVILMGSLLFINIYNPANVGPVGQYTALLILVSFAIGVVSYLSMKAYLNRKGIDVSLAFKTIPPD